jgi:hypothetical protein
MRELHKPSLRTFIWTAMAGKVGPPLLDVLGTLGLLSCPEAATSVITLNPVVRQFSIAQVDQGTIERRVQDTTGAVISGVSVFSAQPWLATRRRMRGND